MHSSPRRRRYTGSWSAPTLRSTTGIIHIHDNSPESFTRCFALNVGAYLHVHLGGPVRLGEDSRPIHTQAERCAVWWSKFLVSKEQLARILVQFSSLQLLRLRIQLIHYHTPFIRDLPNIAVTIHNGAIEPEDSPSGARHTAHVPDKLALIAHRCREQQ